MALDLKKVRLDSKQKKFAEGVLRNWGLLNKGITKLDIGQVRALLAFELATRARLTVVQRLVARYGVLEQKANEREVAEALAKKLGSR